MIATVKSLGRTFPVKMKTTILPGKGYISNNKNTKFGKSGHEELLLQPHPEGTMINYTYEITIHRRPLQIFAQPLIRRYSMRR